MTLSLEETIAANKKYLEDQKLLKDRAIVAKLFLKELLDSIDVELSIWGCGCCGSPAVTFKHKGKTIIDDCGDFKFSNLKEQEEAEE